MANQQDGFKTETVAIADLKPHSRNYREHPDDQLEHIIQSIKDHGFYRNIVIAQDNTILAGHGVVKAAQKMGMNTVPVKRLDVDPDSPQALKVLTGDNEISHLGEIDDRLLSELLKEIKDSDSLLGTGFDEMMLANLVFVTRPESEIKDIDEAAQWVGMPQYEEANDPLKVTISFRNEDDRAEFARILGLKFTDTTRGAWWPPKQKDDLDSLRFKG